MHQIPEMSCARWGAILSAIVSISIAIGGLTWSVFSTTTDWVRLKNLKDEQHDKFNEEISQPVKELIEYNVLQKQRTEINCRVGTLPREWCLDNGYKYGHESRPLRRDDGDRDDRDN